MKAHPTAFRLGLATVAAAVAVSFPGAPVQAGRNDLRLRNLCPQTASAACSWVKRDASGAVTGVDIDADGRSNFRSLMSELGVVLAPKLPMPADTLGFAGFSVDGELAFTQISHDKPFWNGVDAVSPQNTVASRPDATLTTMGVFLRKGFLFPVPALELGGGVVSLLQSQMLAWQGYAKLALHEGYHDLPFPSLAVRAALSYLTGTDQVSLRTTSFDVIVSKGFGLLKTARIEPFGGLSVLLIKVGGKPIDFTPGCDAGAPGQTAQCSPASNDIAATVNFPDQDITRYRVFGGAKLKFGVLAVIGQYEYYPAGSSRDQRSAIDHSAGQNAFTLSTGLDF
jgi:hypothetical protein